MEMKSYNIENIVEQTNKKPNIHSTLLLVYFPILQHFERTPSRLLSQTPLL